MGTNHQPVKLAFSCLWDASKCSHVLQAPPYFKILINGDLISLGTWEFG